MAYKVFLKASSHNFLKSYDDDWLNTEGTIDSSDVHRFNLLYWIATIQSIPNCPLAKHKKN